MNNSHRLAPNELEGWRRLIEEHLLLYPRMTARDVYKLLYQGVLGPEHLMPSREIFIARLEEEIATLEPDSKRMLLEPVRPDGSLQRVYLRPWLAARLGLDDLVVACLRTGAQRWGEPGQLRYLWSWFLDQVEERSFPAISPGEARALDGWLHEDGFPAAHHSGVYLEQYQPAYRLVSAAEMILLETGDR